MAFKFGDRIAESTVSPGTGDIMLAGPIDADHDTFGNQFNDGDTMPVSVFGGGRWMTFVGRYNAGANSLTRITFRRSSTGANLALSGTMTVLCGWGADDAASVIKLGDPDATRQALLHDRIYQSKMLGDVRRVVNAWATGLKAATDALIGINTAASSNVNSAPAATNGYVQPTVTAATQIPQGTGVTIGDMTGDGGIAAAFDGNTTPNDAQCASAPGTPGTTNYVGKNYTGSPKVIGSVNIFPSNASHWFSAGDGVITGTLNIRAKQTAPASPSDGTLLATVTFLEDATSPRTLISNDTNTAWNYAWVEFGNNSATGTRFIGEVQFFAPPFINNMTLVTASQTSDAPVSAVRVMMEIDNANSPILNTDLTVEVTCNGGANWTLATLSLVGTGQSGRKIVETTEQACTAGTSFAARIKTLNNKGIAIHGVSVFAR